MQKVPQQFRQSYIAGQPLDKAFQAICEFIGVDFAYSIEDLSKYNFSTDGYSIEKDGTVIEDVPTILEEFNATNTIDEKNTKTTTDEDMAKSLNSSSFESTGLIEYENNKKSDTKENTQSTNKALNQSTTNSNNQSNTKLPEENSTKNKYQEEFDKKIEDLFKGNTLYDSNISDPILNYNWITVQPTMPQTTSTISSVSGATGTSNSSSNNTNEEQSQSSSSSTSSEQNKQDGVGRTKAGSYYITKDAINRMSMAEAKNKYDYGKAHEPYYTSATMEKLWYRMMFGTKFY